MTKILKWRADLQDGAKHAEEIGALVGLSSSGVIVSVDRELGIVTIELSATPTPAEETAIEKYLSAKVRRIK